jgi:CRP/FNR family cyclic AMP-dependent transcriptional regulator
MPDIRVLDADPDLAAGLLPTELPEATRAAVARSFRFERGPWTPPGGNGGGRALGLLVIEGTLLRSLSIADRGSTELLGTGDLLRPWQSDSDEGLLPVGVSWHVLEPVRLAVLDGRFAAATARWPAITAELVGRAMRRARWQGVFAALSHMTRVDQRLLLAFWHFAERWGRVRPEGILVRLPLTHEQLGALVGARRPSVTTALSSLAASGLVDRRRRGEWLLTPNARDLVDGLRQTAAGGARDALRLAA